MSSQTIFLTDPEQKVNVLGKEFTVDDLKQALIDQAYYKGRLSQLLGGDEE